MTLLLLLLVAYLIAGLIWLSNVANDAFDPPGSPMAFRLFYVFIAPWVLLIAAYEREFGYAADELWKGIVRGRDR